MSETHYWPEALGVHDIEHENGDVETWNQYSSKCWRSPDGDEVLSETGLKEYGYLGVRREQVAEPCVDDTSDKYADAELHADAFNWRHAKEHGIAVTFDGDVIGKATYWEDSGDSSVGIPATGGWELTGSNIGELSNKASRGDDLNALVREAIAEFRRDVKQPTKAADWAFRWANRFIEAVER